MMTRIYLETQKAETSEYQFIKTFISDVLGIDSLSYEIIPVNGKDNLRNIVNKFRETTLEGGRNVIISDSDTPSKGGGYKQRKEDISGFLCKEAIDADIFLFPNDSEDGDFEALLINIVQRTRHIHFFDCYEDYEKCLGQSYEHPNLKGKIFTYVSAQKMSGAQRKKLGQGDWMFNNPDIWNLESVYLLPLKTFLLQVLEGRQ